MRSVKYSTTASSAANSHHIDQPGRDTRGETRRGRGLFGASSGGGLCPLGRLPDAAEREFGLRFGGARRGPRTRLRERRRRAADRQRRRRSRGRHDGQVLDGIAAEQRERARGRRDARVEGRIVLAPRPAGRCRRGRRPGVTEVEIGQRAHRVLPAKRQVVRGDLGCEREVVAAVAATLSLLEAYVTALGTLHGTRGAWPLAAGPTGAGACTPSNPARSVRWISARNWSASARKGSPGRTRSTSRRASRA